MILSLAFLQSKASHIFGGELTYTHISGNTYQLQLTLYGDCGGSAFSGLNTSVPKVDVYNGGNAVFSTNLSIAVPGIEVTPVCPAEVMNTICNNPNGNLPGVKQFIYRSTITLPYTSTNWRFIFTGNLGGTSGAGRSGALDNIVQSGTSYTTLLLIATLNNQSVASNNSSTYTTIPTPFFCINIPQQYNQGGVDADNDALSFELTPALNANNNAQPVTYATGYTYDFPLQTNQGAFNFDQNNGQLSFTPNAIGEYVVVTKVTETRNGIVVGTSMREMTFVIRGNCNNQSPLGAITGSTNGTITSSNSISLCNGSSGGQFSITVSDPDNHNVACTITGLPSWATSNVLNNATPTPTVNISIGIPTPFVLGSYPFFITFQDDGCPLSSKQTIAYNIELIQPINATITTDRESCLPGNDGSVTIAATSIYSPLTYSLSGGSFQTASTFNNLSANTYIVVIKDAQNCTLSSSVQVGPPIKPEILNTIATDISCYGKADGTILLQVQPATSNFNYTIYPSGTTNTQGVFANLTHGSYTLVASDDKNCADTSFAIITEPQPIDFTDIRIVNLNCNKQNGKVIAKSTFDGDSAVYFLRPGIRVSSSGVFENLTSGFYTLTVQNAQGCKKDSVVYVGIDPFNFSISVTQNDLACNGLNTAGSAEVFPINGVPPYTYVWYSEPAQTTPIATNLYYGYYTVSVMDATGCELSKTIYINPGPCCQEVFAPEAFTPNSDGVNDTWGIQTTAGMQIQNFSIFNRWGQRVWSANDQRDRWDGRFNARDAELSTYYYVIKYKCLTDNKEYIKRGDIQLIR